MSKILKKKKKKRSVSLGIVHIHTTFNNTIITFTDSQGNTLVSSSPGQKGFKGRRKSTPYAAQVCVDTACKAIKEHGMKTISIHVKGPGSQRESALRAIFSHDFVVTQIVDVSQLPHNGVKPPKRRRN